MRMWITMIALCCLASCSTIAPAPVDSKGIAFSGNSQDDGIREVVPGGFLVDRFFAETFNARVKLYGKDFMPPLQPLPVIDRQTIDRATMVKSLTMARWQREGKK